MFASMIKPVLNAYESMQRHNEQAAFSEFKYNFTTFQQNIAEKKCFTFKLSDVVIIVLINIMPTMLAF